MEQQQPRKRKGLTYGQVLVVMGAVIALALIATYVQSLLLTNQLGFDDFTFDMLVAAKYDRPELTRAELDTLDKETGKFHGAVVYVKTSEGHYAKLAVAFSKQFYGTSATQFVIYQGVVYNERGTKLRDIYNLYLPLDQRYDLDAGRTIREGASEAGADLAFKEITVGDERAFAVNGALFALPKLEELRR